MTQSRAVAAARHQGHWRCSVQAVQGWHCPQVHCLGPHGHQPDPQGKPQEALQGQEVQVPGPVGQEDAHRHNKHENLKTKKQQWKEKLYPLCKYTVKA